MICENPYQGHGSALHPCGSCLPCRFNARRLWTHRLMLEASLHSRNSFVTLTYDSQNLPTVPGELHKETLRPEDLRNFLKRFRSAISPARLRFYASGEYGDLTMRPHYHLALFGYPPCEKGRTRPDRSGSCCVVCDLVRDKWGLGLVDVAHLTVESAQYICGYVVKKMTRIDDPRLEGRYPEFSRKSLKPGLGADAMPQVAKAIRDYDVEETDVPVALRHGSRQLPLGRYLRRRLRKELGRDEQVPLQTQIQKSVEMLEMFKASVANGTSLKKEYAQSVSGKVARIKGRSRVFKRRGTL